MPPLRELTFAALVGLALPAAAGVQALGGPALARALQHGGYVIVMRHASSPSAPPSPADAEPDNAAHERQLDAAGKAAAADMGAAIRALHIPIGQVWSSPAYRARQTIRLAGLPTPVTIDALGDKGHSMQAAGADQAAWLAHKAAEPPPAGTDTLIVTHQPNIAAAFGQAAAGLGDGEALVFHPDGKRPPEPVARIPMQDWPRLAGR